MPSVAYPILALFLVFGWPLLLVPSGGFSFMTLVAGLLTIVNGLMAFYLLASSPLFEEMCEIAEKYRSGCANITILYMPIVLLAVYGVRSLQALVSFAGHPKLAAAVARELPQSLQDPLLPAPAVLPRRGQRTLVAALFAGLTLAALIKMLPSFHAAPVQTAATKTPEAAVTGSTVTAAQLPDLAKEHMSQAEKAASPAEAAQQAELAAAVYAVNGDQAGRRKALELAATSNLKAKCFPAAAEQFQELVKLAPGEFDKQAAECVNALRGAESAAARQVYEEGKKHLKEGQLLPARDCGIQALQAYKQLEMSKEAGAARKLMEDSRPQPSPEPEEAAPQPTPTPYYYYRPRPQPSVAPALPDTATYPTGRPRIPYSNYHPRRYTPPRAVTRPSPQNTQSWSAQPVPHPTVRPVPVQSSVPRNSNRGGLYQPSGGSYRPTQDPYTTTR